ncbi:MAG TPA: substrate-binding domain-containing protein [Candidatus Omnitrophota bacterium]|nr:substrate-binding domain-containing protein [Candidatus Omnitrophota bacterium]HPT39109.1 substrate-binding domain-containing protein [Candidatus Omnitrophota bacterium]
MHRQKLSIILISFLMLFLLPAKENSFTGKLLAQETTINIDGSLAMLDFTSLFAEEFTKTNPEIKIQVKSTSSTQGFKNLLDGSCDIANISRTLNPEESMELLMKFPNAKILELAYSGVNFIVHKTAAAKKVEWDTLKRALSGEINEWQEINPQVNGKINIYAKQTTNSQDLEFLKILLGGDDIARTELAATDEEVIQKVENDPLGLGVIGAKTGLISKKDFINIDFLTIVDQDGKEKTVLLNVLKQVVKDPAQSDINKFINFEFSKTGVGIIESFYFTPTAIPLEDQINAR